ncbi:hypothetical protein [Aquimarina sp. RZ0]|uniref:hypothetical protein n=1 Tax=Aquimarina sp. RZ0 TaxID=2607730 RepID=UPI0011F3B19A|nr:hypothetical protein [Aquimarina sp. RZ0]KAA1244072.1 hypothetical protein F0000_18280 [Aquimarina sp. RZ0]
MKIIIFIIPICFLSVQSYSQILTSEIAVEPTGNKTIVSGLLEVKAPYDGISQFTVNTTSSNAELRFSKNDTIKGFIWYNASNNLMAFGRGSATNSFFTTTDGKFGVGTTTPRGKLEIKAPYSGDSQLIINTTSSNAELRFSKNSTTKGFVWYDASNDLMAFGRGSATNSFFTTTDGKFGVGTTNPTEKLHVNGNIRATAPVWADFVFDKTYEL